MERQRSLQQYSESSPADGDRSVAMRGKDLQKAMERVAALVGDNPVHAFEAAMHAVTSQLLQAAAARGSRVCPPCAVCRPGLVGLLHRRAGSSMNCFPALRIARNDSGWTLSAADLLGISVKPCEMREWYVLSRSSHGGMRAFRIDAGAAGLRLHHARMSDCNTPFNAHALSLEEVRVRDTDAWDLGHPRSPSETLMCLVSVYRAMAAAMCCGLGRAARRILIEPAVKTWGSVARTAPWLPRASQQLGKIDALLLTSDIVMRGIESEFAAERDAPYGFSSRLHRLAIDSSLAAVSLMWRSGIRQTHTGFASLHQYRRDALAIGALMTVLDSLGGQDSETRAPAPSPAVAPTVSRATCTDS